MQDEELPPAGRTVFLTDGRVVIIGSMRGKRVADAHDLMEASEHFGKIVLRVQ